MQGCQVFNLEKSGNGLLIPILELNAGFDLKKTSK